MISDQNSASSMVTDVAPELLERWLADNDTILIDVREDYEHAQEKIGGSVNRPLSKLDPESIRDEFGGKRLVFHCRSGKRSLDAAQRCKAEGDPAFHLVGGIEQWKASGRDVVRAEHGPRLPIIRQVMLVAGSLVAIGVALGAFVSPWFLILSGFVGCGLMFAGATGWCGMALLLGKMPWNQLSTK